MVGVAIFATQQAAHIREPSFSQKICVRNGFTDDGWERSVSNILDVGGGKASFSLGNTRLFKD